VQYQSWERKEEKERERSKKQGFLGELKESKKIIRKFYLNASKLA
jgi:hypothetical protein